MGEEYLLEEVKSSAGESLAASGDIFQKDIMYWIGYIYRYWHYYTGEDSAKILRQVWDYVVMLIAWRLPSEEHVAFQSIR